MISSFDEKMVRKPPKSIGLFSKGLGSLIISTVICLYAKIKVNNLIIPEMSSSFNQKVGTNPPKRIGLFPKDHDTLMTSAPPSGYEFCYLVAKDSLEETWTKNFLPSALTFYYKLNDPQVKITQLQLIDVLRGSNITEVMKENQIDYLFVDIATEELEQWEREQGIKCLVTPMKFRRIYENKILFDKLLGENGINKPESDTRIFNESNLSLPFSGKQVIQKPLSSGGEGTYFVETISDIKNLIAAGDLNYNENYLFRRFIKGKTYGITVFVVPGMICLSGIRLQCFSKSKYQNRNIFLGVQWVPASNLSSNLKSSLQKHFTGIGKFLYEQKFFGYANIDFLVDEQEQIYTIECNARFSSASVQYIKFPELIGGIDTARIFLEQAVGTLQYQDDYTVYPFPETEFAGSTLKINLYPELAGHELETTKTFNQGIYEIVNGQVVFKDKDIRNWQNSGKQLLYFSDALPGERFKKFAEIARVFSNYPLYDSGGILNNEGELLISYFS